MGYIRAREPEVPPLPGLSCDYRLCFPRLPPWATLWHPSGTPGNMNLVRYLRNWDVDFDGFIRYLACMISDVQKTKQACLCCTCCMCASSGAGG
jgi:hypothetical protein